MFNGLSCVSVAVRDIGEAADFYCGSLGLERIGGEQESPRGFGLRWQELGRDGVTFLELIMPTGDGAVRRFLDSRGEGVYQVRLATANVDRALDAVEARGGRVVRDEHRKPGLRQLGWVHPSSTHGVLIEVVEETP